MVLYTFISKEENEVLNTQGYLICSPEKAKTNIKDWQEAYNFMRDSLEKKYSRKNFPYNIEYPRWAWYQWEGDKDIINNSTVREGYGGRYLLTIDIPEEQVLLSDFDNWHSCLNNLYLSVYEKEEQEASDKLHGEAYTKAKHKSWLRIFDLSYPNQWYDSELYQDCKSIQAVFWVLFKTNVLNIEEVISHEKL